MKEIDPKELTFGSLATDVINHKYSQFPTKQDRQTWPEIAWRVAFNVLSSVGAPMNLIEELAYRIAIRQIIPGGRYLYAAGRPYHQVQNCLLLRAEDSREGWADIMHKASMALMSGAGIGIEYSPVRPRGSLISRTGGEATGPTALMQMVNEAGRHIMQGGSRRSAIWAGLGWNHPDIHDFIAIKNWSPEMRALKAKDFNFPATMDGTNVSVRLDDEFFEAYHCNCQSFEANREGCDACCKCGKSVQAHHLHAMAQQVYWATVRQMLKTGEPGFSIDTGENAGETLRNAPVVGATSVVTRQGIQRVNEIVGVPTTVWTGRQWAEDVVFTKTGMNVPTVTVNMTGGRSLRCDPTHEFVVERYVGKGVKRKLVALESIPAGELKTGDILHVSLPEYTTSVPFFPAAYAKSYMMGFIYGDGSFRDGHAEVSICCESKKMCSAFIKAHVHDLEFSVVKDGRRYERLYFKTNHVLFGGRNKSVFPKDFRTDCGYSARSFLAGLFDADGSYDPIQKRVRLGSVHFDFLRDCQRMLEWLGIQSNISKGSQSGYTGAASWQLVVSADSVSEFARLIPTLRLQPQGHDAYRDMLVKVLSVEASPNADVFCADVKVAEHTFMAEGVIISNCTEVTSFDDSDICNLGSINMARIHTLADMEACVELATALLVAGTVYSDVPYDKVNEVRVKNRRLGLGLMGIHEWMLTHGKKYGPDDDLAAYMAVYARSTEYAHRYEDMWSLSRSVKTRAIAPTGTIGIVAETSTGLEPVFCVAYKRRYLKGNVWNYQYVVDPTAQRLIEHTGIAPEAVEDAYALAEEPERRVLFQAWVQQWVDHGISSTINLPHWGSDTNNDSKVQRFGEMLIKYLPKLRGITCYPDGARGGQPLTAVSYKTAMKHVGQILVEAADVCDISHGGTCGA